MTQVNVPRKSLQKMSLYSVLHLRLKSLSQSLPALPSLLKKTSMTITSTFVTHSCRISFETTSLDLWRTGRFRSWYCFSSLLWLALLLGVSPKSSLTSASSSSSRTIRDCAFTLTISLLTSSPVAFQLDCTRTSHPTWRLKTISKSISISLTFWMERQSAPTVTETTSPLAPSAPGLLRSCSLSTTTDATVCVLLPPTARLEVWLSKPTSTAVWSSSSMMPQLG